MENFNKCDIELLNEDLQEVKNLKFYLDSLNDCFDWSNNNFAHLCFYVYKVKELFHNYNYYNRNNETYSFKSIMSYYGLNDTDVSRLCSCFEKYCSFRDIENEIPILEEPFIDFSKSKLIELLQVPNEQIFKDIDNKVLRPDMSVKTIRDYVKNYNALKNISSANNQEEQIEEFNEEDIPLAYNPKQHYDFEYFEDKTKNQLLNIVWELQKEYEKLKGIKK